MPLPVTYAVNLNDHSPNPFRAVWPQPDTNQWAGLAFPSVKSVEEYAARMGWPTVVRVIGPITPGYERWQREAVRADGIADEKRQRLARESSENLARELTPEQIGLLPADVQEHLRKVKAELGIA